MSDEQHKPYADLNQGESSSAKPGAVAGPDFPAYEQLWERRVPTIDSFVRCSVPKIALIGTLVALCYIAKQLGGSGSELTYLELIGHLAVAFMIVAVGITAFIIGLKYDAQTKKDTPDPASQSRNELGGTKETRKVTRPD